MINGSKGKSSQKESRFNDDANADPKKIDSWQEGLLFFLIACW